MSAGVSASPGVLAAQSSEPAMATRRVVVGSKVGLHARPAAVFVQAANRLPVQVTIAKEGIKPVRAGSILMVLGLDVRGSEEVVLCADGDGATLALNKLADLVARPRRTEP
jgi:phosphocarrier protein HPr